MSTTLYIRVESTDDFHEDTLSEIEALERDEEPEERNVLSLRDEADLQRLFSEKNLELLRTIRQHNPTSNRIRIATGLPRMFLTMGETRF